MNFDLVVAIDMLRRTPDVLEVLVSELPEEWIESNEGGETWSPRDVIGHLIHGERTDWMVRTRIILAGGTEEERTFPPFDRTGHREFSENLSLNELLELFAELRLENLADLKDLALTDEDLAKTGIHPEFGDVTLRQLLATWIVHDYDHLNQITRVLAHGYKEEVGPWLEYLGVLRERK